MNLKFSNNPQKLNHLNSEELNFEETNLNGKNSNEIGSHVFDKDSSKENVNKASFLKHKRIKHNLIDKYTCRICNITFESAKNLKKHTLFHKNQFQRSKFTCLVGDCRKSYLYICTLKKHIASSHPSEINEIHDFYGSEMNFISIFKDILENPSRFNFVKVKNPQNNNNSGNKELNPHKIEEKVEKDCEDLSKFKDEISNYLNQTIQSLKQYFDILENKLNEKIRANYLRFEIPRFENVLTNLNQIQRNQNNHNIVDLINQRMLNFQDFNANKLQNLYEVSKSNIFPNLSLNQNMSDFMLNYNMIINNNMMNMIDPKYPNNMFSQKRPNL